MGGKIEVPIMKDADGRPHYEPILFDSSLRNPVFCAIPGFFSVRFYWQI